MDNHQQFSYHLSRLIDHTLYSLSSVTNQHHDNNNLVDQFNIDQREHQRNTIKTNILNDIQAHGISIINIHRYLQMFCGRLSSPSTTTTTATIPNDNINVAFQEYQQRKIKCWRVQRSDIQNIVNHIPMLATFYMTESQRNQFYSFFNHHPSSSSSSSPILGVNNIQIDHNDGFDVIDDIIFATITNYDQQTNSITFRIITSLRQQQSPDNNANEPPQGEREEEEEEEGRMSTKEYKVDLDACLHAFAMSSYYAFYPTNQQLSQSVKEGLIQNAELRSKHNRLIKLLSTSEKELTKSPSTSSSMPITTTSGVILLTMAGISLFFCFKLYKKLIK